MLSQVFKSQNIHREGAKVAKESLKPDFKSIKTFASFAPWRFKGLMLLSLV
jgi:hypothetical protein